MRSFPREFCVGLEVKVLVADGSLRMFEQVPAAAMQNPS
jgi:hypothetical protein